METLSGWGHQQFICWLRGTASTCEPDAISAAEKLLHSDDKEARYLAQCVIDSEKAIIKSKESFLAEMKRLGIKPNYK